MAAAVALDKTLGSLLIGLVVAAILTGVAIVQASYYFTHQSDAWPLRLLVGVVIALNVLHQALITHVVYIYTITNWGDLASLQVIGWSMIVEGNVNAVIALLVQSFLAFRVWRFSNRNKILTGIIALLIIGEFVALSTCNALTFHFHANMVYWFAKLANFGIAINALAVAGDVLITVSLCILLYRSRTGFRRSDTMISKLMLFTLNTGLLPSVSAIASLISNHMAKDTFINIGFFFSIGRLYTNSLLATLNARKKIREAGSGVQTTTQDLTLSGTTFANMGTRKPTNISIKINTTQELATDEQLDYASDPKKIKVGNLGATAC